MSRSSIKQRDAYARRDPGLVALVSAIAWLRSRSRALIGLPVARQSGERIHCRATREETSASRKKHSSVGARSGECLATKRDRTVRRVRVEAWLRNLEADGAALTNREAPSALALRRLA
jgi:hypothetical protein